MDNSFKDINRWIHPECEILEIEKNGPFVEIKDNNIGCISQGRFCISKDVGKTWEDISYITSGMEKEEPGSRYILKTNSNTLVIAYLNFEDYSFNWDEEKKEPKNGCKLEVWSIRSIDGGKTWIDKQCILDGYNANFFGLIQLKTGRIVIPLQHLTNNPGRLITCSFYSDDEGKTWRRSNWIDLGGHGHHDGAFEPTITELNDGRVLMFIRTSLGYFWQAISDDGKYWRTIQPTKIDASNSPGYLLKLKSGRHVLVWNRENPEDRLWEKVLWQQHTEIPCSWHREELSISFSEDDCKTWTKPIVIAKQKGGQLSYPYLFEYKKGEIWLIAGFAFRKMWEEPLPLKLKIGEEDFFKLSKRGGIYGV